MKIYRNLSFEYLTGPIPESIGKLTKLKKMYIKKYLLYLI